MEDEEFEQYQYSQCMNQLWDEEVNDYVQCTNEKRVEEQFCHECRGPYKFPF